MESFLLMVAAVVGVLLYQRLQQRLQQTETNVTRGNASYQQLQQQLEQMRQELLELRVHIATLRQPMTTPVPMPPSAVAPAPPVVAAPPVALPITPPVVAAPPIPAPPVVAPPAVAPPKPAEPVAAPAPPAPPKPIAPAPAPPAAPVPAPLVAAPAPAPPPKPTAPTPPPAPRPTPVPAEPAGPTWWERVSGVVLENWTGILGAVILVTGVGFLGVYTALQLAPIYRFFLINTFALGLLGARYYFKSKPYAAQLSLWLQSSAAAIFLFTCVASVSIPGLQWATAPFDYLLLFVGAGVNLWLAWNSSRETVASLHGTLSLVALSVLPPTVLTLAAAAAVTVFGILITYRQRWRYQLLLGIVSFFAFHVYWHSQLGLPVEPLVRFGAMALVLLVGAAAAVVQYRRVYASGRFEPLLFAAHVLNWSCLGINLYLHSTGSVWKTIPLGLGAVATFFVARHARRLGIQWLFQTDTVISFILALAAALSLQGWHATPSVILLFMLLESLLVAFIMAREQEDVVLRIAAAGALLAGGALFALNLAQIGSYSPTALHRNTVLLWVAAGAGSVYFHLMRRWPLVNEEAPGIGSRELYRMFGGLTGALYAGGAVLMLRAVFGVAQPPVGWLISGTVLAAGAVFALSRWLRSGSTWFRDMHLLIGQALLMVAVLSLHEAGLRWPSTLLVLHLQSLLAALAFGCFDEQRVQRIVTSAAAAAGVLLLGSSLLPLATLAPEQLHRNTLWLLLAAAAGAAHFRLTDGRASALNVFGQVPAWLHAAGGALVGAGYAGAAGLLLQALFGVAQPPVAGLVSGAAAAAGLAFGLSWWLRGGPEWFRQLHLLAGQALLMVTTLGLHKVGLSWPTTACTLYLETLLMTLLLALRREWPLYRVLLYTTLLLAAALPLLVYLPDADLLSNQRRAALLLLAALATVGAQIWLHRRDAPAYDGLPLSYDQAYRLRLLGFAAGALLLPAGGLVYHEAWAGWAALSIGAGLLLLRRYQPGPGLWVGLLLTTVGYQFLQWHHVHELIRPAPGAVLAYLLPLLAVSVVGLFTSWWPIKERHVRWPWLYLLGAQLSAAAWLAFSPRSDAAPALLWTLLGAVAFFAARILAQRLPDAAAQQRAGHPDRFLLHLSYALLLTAVVYHFAALLPSPERWWGWPARRFTAAGLLLGLAYIAVAAPPATASHRTWRYLHPWLPELALLLLFFTQAWETRVEWHALQWIALALLLSAAGPRLPLRLRRLTLYGLLLFGAAALWASYVALRYLAPGQWLGAPWLATAGAVALLFAYAALVLRRLPSVADLVWPPGLQGLTSIRRLRLRYLVPALLYPAFGALTLLLVQSFDRSILTVLLMLEVVAVFVSSLLLRRRDLRYVALAGVGLCMIRLVFFDLSQQGTITRAVVFILMGLLLLGMNALYARFKGRFASAPDEPAADILPPDLTPDEPDPALIP